MTCSPMRQTEAPLKRFLAGGDPMTFRAEAQTEFRIERDERDLVLTDSVVEVKADCRSRNEQIM